MIAGGAPSLNFSAGLRIRRAPSAAPQRLGSGGCGGGRLELWLLDAAKVGAEAAATAARLCPGLRVGLPREPQWPHEGDCTSECSVACCAQIDWAQLEQT